MIIIADSMNFYHYGWVRVRTTLLANNESAFLAAMKISWKVSVRHSERSAILKAVIHGRCIE